MYSLVKDGLVAGGLAGIIGAALQQAYGLIAKAIVITDRAFIDFAEILVLSRIFTGPLAFIVSSIAHLIVGLFLGVIFAYVIKLTSSNYYLLKGLGYGIVWWMLLMGFGTIFRLPVFSPIPPAPALSTLVGAAIYGLTTAYTLGILDKKTKIL